MFGEPTEKELLAKIADGTDTPPSNDEFLLNFQRGQIHVFDHRAHLRIGFIILFRCAKQNKSPSHAVDEFTRVLRSFFSLADKSQIRPTFHLTMTIFWCHAVNLALVAFIDKSEETHLAETAEEELFVEFLKSFPILMWGGLWTKYYSKDKLMSAHAKENYIIPDLAPFPAYMTLQGASSKMAEKSRLEANNKNEIKNQQLSDDEFYNLFDECSLQEFDELSLMRICFLKLSRNKNERRAVIVNQTMETLQRLLMRIRAKNSKCIVFSHTQTYFWIQVMHIALSSLEFKKSENFAEEIAFHSINSLFPELSPETQPWKKFYSEQVFNSVEARRNFVAPDIKALPNFFSKVQVSDDFLVSVTDVLSRRPSLNILKQVHGKLQEHLNAIETVVVHIPENAAEILAEEWQGCQLQDEAFVFAIRFGKLSKISHFDVLRMIFVHVKQGWERGDRGTVAVTRIADHLECFWEGKKVFARGELDISPMSTEKIFKDLFEDRFSREYSGLTHIHFWIQMVIASMVKATHSNAKCLLDFVKFLGEFPELLWDKLWSVYYSELVCFSPEAKAMVVPADVHSLPAFLAK